MVFQATALICADSLGAKFNMAVMSSVQPDAWRRFKLPVEEPTKIVLVSVPMAVTLPEKFVRVFEMSPMANWVGARFIDPSYEGARLGSAARDLTRAAGAVVRDKTKLNGIANFWAKVESIGCFSTRKTYHKTPNLSMVYRRKV